MTNEKLIADWKRAEEAGLVRLLAEHEQESYFDVYGLPLGYTNNEDKCVTPEEEYEEMLHDIKLNGCWYVYSEYFDGEDWQHADSIGMCIGYKNPLSPEENCYVLDLMRSALALISQI